MKRARVALDPLADGAELSTVRVVDDGSVYETAIVRGRYVDILRSFGSEPDALAYHRSYLDEDSRRAVMPDDEKHRQDEAADAAWTAP